MRGLRVYLDDEASYISPLYNGIVGVDNTACGQPALISGGVTGTDLDIVVTPTRCGPRCCGWEKRRRDASTGLVWSGWAWIDTKNARGPARMPALPIPIPAAARCNGAS